MRRSRTTATGDSLKRFALALGTAAGVPAAVLLSTFFSLGLPEGGEAVDAVSDGPPDQGAVCRVSPAVLDVSRSSGPLTARIELRTLSGEGAKLAPPAEAIDPGIYISSVDGVRLPVPSAITEEGIGERFAGRSVEPVSDAPPGTGNPGGSGALIVRFDRPSDGNPATHEDGDAGDILAMLMGVPDGTAAPVCIAGRAAGESFECCDTVVVRNRGLRDLPRGLTTTPSR